MLVLPEPLETEVTLAPLVLMETREHQETRDLPDPQAPLETKVLAAPLV